MAYPTWAAAMFKRLQKLRETKPGREWTTLCPAHDDQNPSLSISFKEGRLLLFCHACHAEQDAILAVLGLDWRCLMPLKPPDHSTAPKNGKHGQQRGQIVATYDYTDESGTLLFQVLRYDPKRFVQRAPDGDGGWNYKLDGARRVLYRLPELLADIHTGRTIYLPEGEQDVDNLRVLGFAATCNSGGSGKWLPEYTETLQGADVVILPDNDKPGRAHRDLVAKLLQGAAARVRVLELPGLPEKGDVSDWIKAGGTREELQQMM